MIEPKLLDHPVILAEADLSDRDYTEWDIYRKTPDRAIRPSDVFAPYITKDNYE